MPDRFAEWEAQLARVRARGATAEGRLRLEFDDDVSVPELASLVAAEQHCCAFLAFAITIDHRGVGELIGTCTERGRAVKPDLEIGVCGEHGGDPESIRFFHGVGRIDYVSCSPFRVPVARLAAAHAVLDS